MQSKTSKFIIFIVGLVVIFIGIGLATNKAQAPGKYDDFAKALKDSGAQFYGAFWCPHCQAQKAQFGSSKQYLPYVECSNPDNSQTKICADNKIESFPTWSFKDGITVTSEEEPVVCSVQPGVDGELDICKNINSEYFKTWLFKEHQFSIKSPTAPVKTGKVWKFPSTARITGEVPLEFLAEMIHYTLPK